MQAIKKINRVFKFIIMTSSVAASFFGLSVEGSRRNVTDEGGDRHTNNIFYLLFEDSLRTIW